MVGAEVKGRGGGGGVRVPGMAVIGGVFGLLRGSSPAEGAAGKGCPPHSWLLPARERGLWGAAVTVLPSPEPSRDPRWEAEPINLCFDPKEVRKGSVLNTSPIL